MHLILYEDDVQTDSRLNSINVLNFIHVKLNLDCFRMFANENLQSIINLNQLNWEQILIDCYWVLSDGENE